MPLTSRVGIDQAGGGLISNPLQLKLTIQGALCSVVGDRVDPHPPSHILQFTGGGSVKMTIQGLAVCRGGDLATCGHTLSGSGPVNVLA